MNGAASISCSPATVLGRPASPRVDWVEVEGEVVAWHQESESLHLLDPIASLVFQLCDGATPLADTIDDLADAFGKPATEVAHDILTCAASLEDLGILARVD